MCSLVSSWILLIMSEVGYVENELIFGGLLVCVVMCHVGCC